jgi:hypothetical protein
MRKKTKPSPPLAIQATDEGITGNCATRYLNTLIRLAHFNLVPSEAPPGYRSRQVTVPQALKACELYLKVDIVSDAEHTMLELIEELRAQELPPRRSRAPLHP